MVIFFVLIFAEELRAAKRFLIHIEILTMRTTDTTYITDLDFKGHSGELPDMQFNFPHTIKQVYKCMP